MPSRKLKLNVWLIIRKTVKNCANNLKLADNLILSSTRLIIANGKHKNQKYSFSKDINIKKGIINATPPDPGVTISWELLKLGLSGAWISRKGMIAFRKKYEFYLFIC